MALNGKGAASGAASGAAAGSVAGPWGAAIGGVVGGVAGALSGGDDQSAEDAQKAYDEYYNVGQNQPDLATALALQTYNQGGKLTPEMLQKLNLNADKATTLVENTQDTQHQQAALNALKQLSQSGMSAQDLAQTAQMRSQVAGDTQAKIQSILQQQQMRGQASGGNTLAAQLSAVQNGNQQASKDAMQTASNAESARNQALMNYANLSGQIRGQDYNTQKYNSDNELQRQRFLDQNSLSRQSTNTAANNNASLYNLQRSQSVQDSNTGAYNQEQARQAAAREQQFQNALSIAQSKANALNKQGSISATQAANSAQNFSNVANGVGQLAQAGKQNGTWDNLFKASPSEEGENAYKLPEFGSSANNSTPNSTANFGGLGLGKKF